MTSIRAKLLAIVLFVGIVPLAVSSATGLRVHQRAYDTRILDARRDDARHGAEVVRERLEQYARGVGLLAQQVVRWNALDADERSGALWLVYRQFDEIAAAALLDAAGAPVGSIAFRDPSRTDPELEAHPAASKALLDALPSQAPDAERGPAIGKPFTADGVAWPVVPVTVPVAGPDGAKWRVVVAVSLVRVCASTMAQGARRLLVGPDGAVLCGVEPKVDRAALLAIEGSARVDGDDGGVLAGSASLPGGWRVISVEPAKQAWAASRRIRAQALLWLGVGAGVALVSGVLLARGISGPVARLEAGAKELAGGNLAHRLPAESRDELGRLAGTFNYMSEEIAKRDSEIRAWNAQLQQRVEQRTAELKQTQDLLFQSQKIAAVSSLGAGIAHEMFSPLTGILGITQVLLARAKKGGSKDVERLEDILREANRLQSTVEQLRAIAESAVGEGMERTAATTILDAAIRPHEKKLEEAGVSLTRQYSDGLEVFCDRPQLVEAVSKIVDNARISMSGKAGGRLSVLCFPADDKRMVRLVVNDTGKGIPEDVIPKIFDPFFTTKDEFRGEGLGLTFAFRAVQRHHGTIEVSSKVGRGTSVTITLPMAAGAHLA